jgi:hypothetical protein
MQFFEQEFDRACDSLKGKTKTASVVIVVARLYLVGTQNIADTASFRCDSLSLPIIPLTSSQHMSTLGDLACGHVHLFRHGPGSVEARRPRRVHDMIDNLHQTGRGLAYACWILRFN